VDCNPPYPLELCWLVVDSKPERSPCKLAAYDPLTFISRIKIGKAIQRCKRGHLRQRQKAISYPLPYETLLLSGSFFNRYG